MRSRSLAGQVVAVTGGARGIGRATAVALVRRGARVAIGDLDLAAAQRAAGELGESASGFALDVTDRDSFAHFLDAAEQQLGPLYALVNNAGIMPLAPFLEESDATARRQIDVNVHGVLFGMKLAIPRMQERGSGHVVNIASMAGKVGIPGGATYCATKHAVVGVSEAVRFELRGSGVELSVVMPAVVNTELGSGLPRTPGVPLVEAEDVAAAIVAALERPRFDVYVPRKLGAIDKVARLLPRRGRDALSRCLKSDRVLTTPDALERAAYEARIRAEAVPPRPVEGADGHGRSTSPA